MKDSTETNTPSQKTVASKIQYFYMFLSAFLIPFVLGCAAWWIFYSRAKHPPMVSTFYFLYAILFSLGLFALVVIPLFIFIKRSHSASKGLLINSSTCSSQISDNNSTLIIITPSIKYYYSNFGWACLFLLIGAYAMLQFYYLANDDFESNVGFYTFLRGLLVLNKKPTFALTVINSVILPIFMIIFGWLLFSSIKDGYYDEADSDSDKSNPFSPPLP